MDNLEYLNQISKSNRPTKKSFSSAPMSTIIKIAIGGVVLFILLIAVGSLIGNLSGKVNDSTKQLYYRTNQINSTIRSYTNSLKSSRLRAISVSLQSVLSGANKQLQTYYKDHGIESEDIELTGKLSEEEDAIISSFNRRLQQAKLNGILDRIYDSQLKLQVSLLISLTSQVITRANDEDLLEIVEPLHESLVTIHENLEAYSNPGS